MAPLVGEKLAIVGPVYKVKSAAVPVTPEAVTFTFPVGAPVGTVTTICVGLQLVAVANTPPKETVLVPWLAPKLVPLMVTVAPIGAVAGERLEIFGGPGLTKSTPLLGVPEIVATTDPVVALVGTIAVMLVALQLVTLASNPLNVTALLPWEAPKSAPEITTEVPAGPIVGNKLKIVGTFKTVKLTALLGTAATVTTTLPVVAPEGTAPVMLVADQLVIVIGVPFSVTLLVPCVSPKLDPVI